MRQVLAIIGFLFAFGVQAASQIPEGTILHIELKTLHDESIFEESLSREYPWLSVTHNKGKFEVDVGASSFRDGYDGTRILCNEFSATTQSYTIKSYAPQLMQVLHIVVDRKRKSATLIEENVFSGARRTIASFQN